MKESLTIESVRSSKVNLATVASDSILQLRAELMKDARELFKIDKYGNMPGPLPTYGTLAAVLKKLDIQPLNENKVKTYKASKEKSFVRKSTYFYAGVFTNAVVACGLALAGQLMGLYGFSAALAGTYIGATVVSTILALCLLVDKVYSYKRELRWREVGLVGYTGFIPETALSMAVQIKKECAAAEFAVEELGEVLIKHETGSERRRREAEERREWLRRHDPFLIVKLGSEKFYLDVWDEDNFERFQ